LIIHSALLHHNDTGQWLLFANPVAVLTTRDPQRVVSVMTEVEARVESESLTAVGFVTYEAALGFDPSMSVHADSEMPLICFGLFSSSEVVAAPVASEQGSHQLWRFTESARSHRDSIEQIRDLIAAGSVYQINHTTRLQGVVNDPSQLFADVAAGAPHAAFIEGDSHTIVSASPECFFALDGEQIYSQPMKGTASRKNDPATDQAQRDWLAASTKNQAENLMITDMVRNDLGRIAEPGSVQVSKLFAMERYPTVWQMTSRVEARTQASVTEIFRELFPAASITGAPKRASMLHIRDLETTPREIYTGAIGYIAPKRQAHFNIAIRTALIDNASGVARYGAGGGVVWDSKPVEEHAELISKTRILKQAIAWEEFALFETMAWSPQTGPKRLDQHLLRMGASAQYFGLMFDRPRALEAIAMAVERLDCSASEIPFRLRLTLDGAGDFVAQLEPAPESTTASQALALVPWRVNSQDPCLHHKTTCRDVYVRARKSVAQAHKLVHVEPLLVNERDEITETDIANVVFKLAGQLYTPPQSCGLLPGVMRDALLRQGKLQERVLRLEQLADVEAFYLVNDLRGWRDATLLS
jgi:para-aminobenzoate synthetase/4-amino-4-deoxychorismate lyase